MTEEASILTQTCPHCGAPLHPDAVFCPYCARSVNRRIQRRPPRPVPRALRYAAVLVLAAAALVLTLFFATRPRTYDGWGEVIYTDSDGTYQLVLARPENRYQPAYELNLRIESGEPYRVPSRLYINHMDSGADAGALFLQKVASAEAELILEEGSPAVLTCSQPAPHSALPDAALASLVDYEAEEDFSAQMVWTLHMDRGDTIRLRQDYHVTRIPTYDYYPQDVPMGTTGELQALIDEIAATVEPEAVVNLYLPAVTYEGSLTLSGRSFNLYGAEEGGTVFAGPVRIDGSADSQISYLYDIDFQGEGTGVGLSTAARARAVNCTFTGWKTGFLGYGTAWVNVIGCTFEGNETGFQFNSLGGSVNHSMYNDNVFRRNGTAVVLENVPSDLALNFENSVFSDNETDIDNRCGQPVDISRAIFQ